MVFLFTVMSVFCFSDTNFFVRKMSFFCSGVRFFGPNGVHRFSGGEAPRPPWPVYRAPAQKPEEKISGLRRARAERARIREKNFSPKSGRQIRFYMGFNFFEPRHTFCPNFSSFRIGCYFFAIFFCAVIRGARCYARSGFWNASGAAFGSLPGFFCATGRWLYLHYFWTKNDAFRGTPGVPK